VENEWIARIVVYRFDDRRRLAPAVSDCGAVFDVQGGAFKYKRSLYQEFQYWRAGFAFATSLNLLLHFCRLETIPHGESGIEGRESGVRSKPRLTQFARPRSGSDCVKKNHWSYII